MRVESDGGGSDGAGPAGLPPAGPPAPVPSPLPPRPFPGELAAHAAAQARDGHGHAFMARLRQAGANPAAFRNRGVFPLAATGLGILTFLAVIPFADPQRIGPYTERLATLGALVFLVAAPGLWLGLRRRAFLIATTVVLSFYGVTAWSGAAFALDDLFLAAVVLGFVVFGLSGFNLVFVLEEIVYDAHRHLPRRVRGRFWAAIPTTLVVLLVVGLPLAARQGLPHPTALWFASLAGAVLMAAWWLFYAVNRVEMGPAILRELHLFVVGILLACALADALPYLISAEELIPSLVAYLALLGTWFYVSYTTLQRTHFLLRGRNAMPWVAILLAATYAIVAHGQAHFLESGTEAVTVIFEQRMWFMIAGVWIGIAFYVARSVWRGLRLLQRTQELGSTGRGFADQAARVAQGVLATERRVGAATVGLYRALDGMLPGSPALARPPPAGWELEEGSLTVRAVKDEPDE